MDNEGIVEKAKRKNWLIFLLVTAVVFVPMFITHIRSSFETSLSVPSGGITRLYTVGESLVAVLSENQLYIWKWGSIKEPPEKVSLPSGDSLWLPTGKLISVPVNAPDTIVITDVTANKELKRFNIGYGWVLCNLNLSSNGQFIVAAFGENVNNFSNNDSYRNIRIVMLPKDFNDLITVVELNKVIVSSLAISSDGKFIAVVGRENDIGWIEVIDADSGKTIWQQNINETEELTKVVFSPANDTVYATGIGRTIYAFRIDDGGSIGQYHADKTTIPQKRQYISTIAVSNDKRFLAANTEPSGMVYVWDIVKGREIYRKGIGLVIVNNLAFSPKSDLFAVTGIKSDQIKIFKMPD